jgi:hypothetical protein
MRAEGLLNYEIAERLGATVAAVANAVMHMRELGWEVATTAYHPSACREGAR